jgi:hypothetical protein
MSDVSVLSHEYKTASELSQAMSRALIALKRVRLGVEGTSITPEDLKRTGCELAEIVSAMADLLDPAPDMPLDERAAARVPGTLVTRLRAAHRGRLPYYLDDLRAAAGRLGREPAELTDQDLTLLDALTAAVDAEASSVFRRLMRR